MASQLKNDLDFINNVSTRLCEQVINNETFRQIIFDTLSLEFKINLSQTEKEAENWEKENKLLQMQVESQEQYSRRNCLSLHGIPVAKLEGENSYFSLYQTPFPCLARFLHHQLI